jgi:eukaryotic-like serine/threonine-protein kinase
MSETQLPSPLSPGYRLEKYTITQLLGRGRTTEVYRATHPELEQPVAIKLYHPVPGRETDIAVQFLSQAETIAALKHPNIIRILGFGLHRQAAYIVMELIEGTRLRDTISAHPTGLTREDTMRIFSQIASAVAYAHDQGIVHGNIKPDDVLLDSKQRPVLIDFNIPCLAIPFGSANSPTRNPAYLSPQQLSQQPTHPADDIYALGILLYEMITGDVPFRGKTFEEVVEQHLHTPPTPPSKISIGLDPRLEQVVLKALSKDPADRHASARDMITEMENEASTGYETLTLDRNSAELVRKRRSEIARFNESRVDEPLPQPAKPPGNPRSWLLWLALGGVSTLLVVAIVLAALLL